MPVRMIDPQAQILQEIADTRMTRDDVVITYAFCIYQKNEDRVDFHVINQAIIDRWSTSALTYIKREAWNYFKR